MINSPSSREIYVITITISRINYSRVYSITRNSFRSRDEREARSGVDGRKRKENKKKKIKKNKKKKRERIFIARTAGRKIGGLLKPVKQTPTRFVLPMNADVLTSRFSPFFCFSGK